MNSKKDLTESELYTIGARYCSGAEHCLSEVRAKLMRGTDDEDVCDRVLQRLVADRFIDEDRYVRAFISDKFRFAKWGKKKIQQELWCKEISGSVSWTLLDEIDADSYRETLKELIESKRKSVKGRNAYEVKMKLARFAASRGFETELIFECLDNG